MHIVEPRDLEDWEVGRLIALWARSLLGWEAGSLLFKNLLLPDNIPELTRQFSMKVTQHPVQNERIDFSLISTGRLTRIITMDILIIVITQS